MMLRLAGKKLDAQESAHPLGERLFVDDRVPRFLAERGIRRTLTHRAILYDAGGNRKHLRALGKQHSRALAVTVARDFAV